MSNTYKIQAGDTLSALALKFNTDVATLQRLNADQIKNIDLIYDGKTLTIPAEPELDANSVVDQELLPFEQLTLTQCTKIIYTDTLFVPSHPKDGRSRLIYLTKSAVDAVKSQHKTCATYISSKDKKEQIKGLARLGVLDSFNSLAHEAFLRYEDASQADLYKTALLELESLKRHIGRDPDIFPAENEAIGLKNIQKRIDVITAEHQRKVDDANGLNPYAIPNYNQGYLGWTISKSEVLKRIAEQRDEQLFELQQDLIDGLEKSISKFEKKAIKIAGTMKLNNGDKHFAFTTAGYYSSDSDIEIEKQLKILVKERDKLNLFDTVKTADLTESSDLPNLKIAHRHYTYWKNNADQFLKSVPHTPYTYSYFNHSGDAYYSKFFQAIYHLNQQAVLVKEQCLSESELFEGSSKVQDFVEYLDDAGHSIFDVLRKLKGIAINNLGYYPSYVLGLAIAREAGIRIKDFNKRIGNNRDYTEYVNQILNYSVSAEKRCQELEKIADSQVSAPTWFYRKPGQQVAGKTVDVTSTTLIWDEAAWKPKNLTNQIYAQSQQLSRTIVECMLASEPKKILYILSDHPVLSEKVSEHKQCVLSHSFDPYKHSAGGGATGNTLAKALEGARGGSQEYTFGSFEVGGTKYLLDKVPDESIWAWGSGDTQIFGLKGRYDTTTGAQFMRFICSAGTSLSDSNIKEAFGHGTLKAGMDLKVGVDLASAQSELTIYFPDTGWYHLDIPYSVKTKHDNGKVDITTKRKNIGDMNIVINGKVFGAIAASLQLATEVKVGNVGDGALGALGTVPNISRFTNFTDNDTHDGNTAGTEFKSEAKAFAGLEVGGSLSCACNWKPVNESKSITLVKVSSGARFTAGFGAECLIQCSFQNGRFYLIMDISATAVSGFGGKFATELNPLALDDFFTALLKVMREPGFSKFIFFDESDNSLTFEMFNVVLTVAASCGLSIGQVLMMPFSVIRDLEEKALVKENSYYVANFLTSDIYLQKNEKWIKNAPAETIAKLLSALTVYKEKSLFGLSREEALTQNEKQREAILKILKWMLNEKNWLGRYQNAVERIHSDGHWNSDDKYKNYVHGFLSIVKLFEKPNFDKLDQKENKHERNYNEQIRFLKSHLDVISKKIRIYSKMVTSNMTINLGEVEYTVVIDNDDQFANENGFREKVWF